MSFFSSIKENLEHGGVKLEMQAPASVSMNDADLPVRISLTGGESTMQINKVEVDLYAQPHNQNFNMGGNMNNNEVQAPRIVAHAENDQAFSLQPGQTQQLQLNIVMNAGGAIARNVPDGAMKSFAEAAQRLQSVTEALSANDNTYYLRATARIDGIKLGPAKQQPIQVLKPGQIGGGLNINL